MNPVVCLGLAQPKVQAVHGLQRIGLLIDEDKKPLVFHLGQEAFGAPAHLPLAYFALPGFAQRITSGIGRDKRWQHTQKLLAGCLTDKSEVCLPTSPFIVVFFLAKPFLEEYGYGEHTLSLYYAGSGARPTCPLGRPAPPEDPGVDAGGPHTLGLDQPDRLGTLRGESSPI